MRGQARPPVGDADPGVRTPLPSRPLRSDRVGAALTRADADRLVDRADEDLAVADAAGMGRVLDRLDGAFDQGVLHDDLDLHLRQEIHHVLGAAVELGMAFLATETLGLGHGDALDPHLVQGVLHFVELEGLDDGFDLLHRSLYPLTRVRRLSPDRLTPLSMVHARKVERAFYRLFPRAPSSAT